MAQLSAFVFTTLNGYLNDLQGDISWHRHGAEENEFASNSMASNNTLLFGRKTYQLMASYWPTPMALANDPLVAEGMNSANKIVFSNTLEVAEWQGTSIIKGDIIQQVKALKNSATNDMTLLGSGSILALFAEHGLIDELNVMIDPVAIGAGSTLFAGIKQQMNLELVNTKTMKSGVVLLNYKLS